jgi:hypothetical protein
VAQQAASLDLHGFGQPGVGRQLLQEGARLKEGALSFCVSGHAVQVS